MQERKLIQALKQKSPDALSQLIQQYSPYVGTIVRNIIGKQFSEEDVEEVTADVFVAVWNHTDQLRPGKLSPFLAAIARNLSRNRIRSYHETVDFDELISICADDNVESEIDQKMLGEILRDVLNMLSSQDKEILVRYYYCYESVSQIAKEKHMTESAVKMRMSRARKKMQQELIDRGYAYEESPVIQQLQFTGTRKKGVTL